MYTKTNTLPNWTTYWSANPSLFGIVMQQSTCYFAQQLTQKGILQKGQKILDFGCGPGYLTSHFIPYCIDYQGFDISLQYIDHCKEQFKAYPYFHFSALTPTVGKSGLQEAATSAPTYDLIVINSVIQYFSSKEIVAELLAACKNKLSSGGQIILADVVTSDKGLKKDAIAVLKHSIKNGYAIAFFKFMCKAKLSGYNQIRKQQPLLSITIDEIEAICKQLQLNCTIIENCTLQESRTTFSIRF